MKNYKIKILFVGIFLLTALSCTHDPIVKDLQEIDLTDKQDVLGMINGVYSDMADYRYWGRNVLIVGEVRADNIFSNGNSGRFPKTSAMQVPVASEPNEGNESNYQYPYSAIGKANIIINSSPYDVVDSEKSDVQHMLGEAYLARAMAHFDLVRMFGQLYINEGSNLGVPYVTEFHGENMQVPRESIEDNKTHIDEDIAQAIKFMNEGSDSALESNKVNFTIDAAYALMSRVGIYFKDYEQARTGAEPLIGKYPITSPDKYSEYWAQSEPGEASIFELYRSPNETPGDGGLAQLYRGEIYGDIEVFKEIFDDADFDRNNDVRATPNMIGPDPKDKTKLRNLGKYPSSGTEISSDNIKIFRYEEVVLNYAEALMNQDPGKALDLLNSIPSKRNAQTYSEATLDNILKERRKEFIFEGFRFYDLARTGRDIREVSATTPNNHHLVKAGDNRFALPIPQHEIDSYNVDSPLVQNPGY